ncbi:Protein of unknown function [Pyronema omphalodes CBS 100304]|uniref:Uncharacterized protein n=1 Tax=Pyronema omphalodes (strain CBS 100304) TaxID=1076935 RepID=U4LC23_PYROM|nr:Protein of unknown function [Pyronema omphalodes CBS 100304]
MMKRWNLIDYGTRSRMDCVNGLCQALRWLGLSAGKAAGLWKPMMTMTETKKTFGFVFHRSLILMQLQFSEGQRTCGVHPEFRGC